MSGKLKQERNNCAFNFNEYTWLIDLNKSAAEDSKIAFYFKRIGGPNNTGYYVTAGFSLVYICQQNNGASFI
jgi:hypothetical protein